MADFSSIMATIDANIKSNGNQEITGSVLNSVLNDIIEAVNEKKSDLVTIVPNEQIGGYDISVGANPPLNVVSREQLDDKLDKSIVLDTGFLLLDESSPYYVETMSGAYMSDGIITQNPYTRSYSILLFRLPAGEYRLKSMAGTPAYGVVIGAISSYESFVVGGQLSSIFVTSQEEPTESMIVLEEESLVLLLNLEWAQLGTIEKYVIIKNRIEDLESAVDQIKEDLYVGETINLDTDSPYHIDTLPNVYIPNGSFVRSEYTSYYTAELFRVPAGKYRLSRFADYANRGTIIGKVNSLADFSVGGNVTGFLGGQEEQTILVSLNAETLLVLMHLQSSTNDLGAIGQIDQLSPSEAISKLKEEINDLFNVDLDVVIPDVVYAIEGTELNLWNDAVSLSVDKGLHSPMNYMVRWECSKGLITDRCFRFTPSAVDVGDCPCTCYLYDMRGVLVSSKTFTIKVVAKNALSSAKNIVYFGDSLGADAATALFNNFGDSSRFGGTKPNMLGTRGLANHFEAVGGYGWWNYATNGQDGFRVPVAGISSVSLYSVYTDGTHNFEVAEVNITEGVGNILLIMHYTNPGILSIPSGILTKVSGGGDATISYTGAYQESANPLWNGQTNRLDIDKYKQTLVNLGQLSSVNDKIDAVSFQFGINDNNLANDLATLKNYIVALYNLFVTDNAGCKFIVGLTTSSGNDVNGNGANYGATQDWKGYLKNTYKIRKFYIGLLSELPNMRIATPNLSLDRYYGYDLGTRQVSDRCSVTEQYHTNYVHPTTSGYNQMGDAYLAAYVSVLTE